jgi:hypothetical protein
MVPAETCISAPTPHTPRSAAADAWAVSKTRTISPTEMKVASAARNVPTAVSSSDTSILPSSRLPGRDALKAMRWRVDAQVEADCADNRHHEEKGRIGERGDTRARLDPHEQTGGRADQGKARALEQMRQQSRKVTHRHHLQYCVGPTAVTEGANLLKPVIQCMCSAITARRKRPRWQAKWREPERASANRKLPFNTLPSASIPASVVTRRFPSTASECT